MIVADTYRNVAIDRIPGTSLKPQNDFGTFCRDDCPLVTEQPVIQTISAPISR